MTIVIRRSPVLKKVVGCADFLGRARSVRGPPQVFGERFRRIRFPFVTRLHGHARDRFSGPTTGGKSETPPTGEESEPRRLEPPNKTQFFKAIRQETLSGSDRLSTQPLHEVTWTWPRAHPRRDAPGPVRAAARNSRMGFFMGHINT
jgi:hypothetical protein